MIRWLKKKFRFDDTPQERENTRRLEKAERELEDLKTRGEIAGQALEARRARNHWRESIERMIQGV